MAFAAPTRRFSSQRTWRAGMWGLEDVMEGFACELHLHQGVWSAMGHDLLVVKYSPHSIVVELQRTSRIESHGDQDRFVARTYGGCKKRIVRNFPYHQSV